MAATPFLLVSAALPLAVALTRGFHGHALGRPAAPVEPLAGELVRGQHRPHGRMALAHEVGIGSRNALRRALANLG